MQMWTRLPDIRSCVTFVRPTSCTITRPPSISSMPILRGRQTEFSRVGRFEGWQPLIQPRVSFILLLLLYILRWWIEAWIPPFSRRYFFFVKYGRALARKRETGRHLAVICPTDVLDLGSKECLLISVNIFSTETVLSALLKKGV